ncbi:hypothetical protein FISHEDRAFT_75009 [Fistulina hepatica ATCC 64428]|uniref:P-loop containing nucleoside triphosphate hydrolase protein n=1 Tax=Fistulina hepatica ATCC 64428 TaxID=1128425 RepID=A0A0D7A8H0_9AGAR|nr:hypothetical protein FISHEDRAFT_75009 [Fistulina hepatica ATCC 64428]
MAASPKPESLDVRSSETIDSLSDAASSLLNSDTEAKPAVNATDINSSIFARKWKEIITLHKDLTELGASDFSQHHARITVIGGQSAGKSSLVEAVSGISVPRDSGTCTRCPMECTMSSGGESWSCQISLRYDHDSKGVVLPEPRTEEFGPRLTSREDVELWLRRAQAAILSPHRSKEYFYNKETVDIRPGLDSQRLSFSKNVVVVHLEDPSFTDLSFVDLPGLIQNAEQNMINLVRDLVVSRIKGDNTIILVTVPMSDDLENQEAVRLAREVDPKGQRTIVVLTKPDTVTEGQISAREKWKALLEGRSVDHRLRHGYFCVRLRDDAERARNSTRSEAEEAANLLFSQKPWSEITDRSRFGVDNLVDYLSRLLIQLIEENLPELWKDIDSLLAECTLDLSQLPSRIEARGGEINTEATIFISHFCDDVRRAVTGTNCPLELKTFVQANRKQYKSFKQMICQTRPNFTVNVATSISKRSVDSQPMDLSDVRGLIESSKTWELPGHIPFEATMILVDRFTSKWAEPTVQCFNQVCGNLLKFLDDLTLKHFDGLPNFLAFVKIVCHKRLDAVREAAEAQVRRLIARETGRPLFTQNDELLEATKKTWHDENCRGWDHTESHSTHKDEIEIMSLVRAYFEVAYKRIIDTAPMLIEHELNQTMVDGLLRALVSGLADDTQSLETLLDEDPAISRRRTALQTKQKRLGQIRALLERWELDASAYRLEPLSIQLGQLFGSQRKNADTEPNVPEASISQSPESCPCSPTGDCTRPPTPQTVSAGQWGIPVRQDVESEEPLFGGGILAAAPPLGYGNASYAGRKKNRLRR